MKIEKPWGYEIIWAQTDKYVGKILFINKGHKLSKQYHEIKDESILVQSGILTLELGDDTLILEPGESCRITTKTIHRMIADSDDVTIIEVSTPELNDVIRLQDDYKRA